MSAPQVVFDRSPTIFLVDDERNNLLLLERSLREYNYDLRFFSDGAEVLAALELGETPDLILSDVMMPHVDGFQLCELVKKNPNTAMIPLVLVTGMTEIRSKVRGLEAGADDFLHKPFHPLELRSRVKSLLRIKALNDQLEDKNAQLEDNNQLLADEKVLLERLVRERTRELESLNIGLTAALERANRMNDEDTGNHIKRVCLYAEMLANGFGLDSETSLKVFRYASLHDVGKVGIPDQILKKPGPLTAEEWVEMRKHTIYGYELLVLAGADIVARNIALCHHERWDGAGYPYGLMGEEIPIEARVVTLADVYDALTSKRCYKPAFSAEKTERIIRQDSGKHFDPEIVQILFDNMDRVAEIRAQYQDTGDGPSEIISVTQPPRHILERRRLRPDL